MAFLFVLKESHVLCLKTAMTKSDIFVHVYDNGFLLDFNDWCDYMFAKMLMVGKKYFFMDCLVDSGKCPVSMVSCHIKISPSGKIKLTFQFLFYVPTLRI